jgi:hypothetical protein
MSSGTDMTADERAEWTRRQDAQRGSELEAAVRALRQPANAWVDAKLKGPTPPTQPEWDLMKLLDRVLKAGPR